MSTLTETQKAGDVILAEQDFGRSRENVTVLDGEVIRIGQAIALNSANKAIAIDGPADEVQTLAISGSLTAGTFTIFAYDKNGVLRETAPLAYNANGTAVAAALNAVLGTSAVAVSASTPSSMAITFSGTGYAKLTQPLVYADTTNLTGATGQTTTRTTPASGAGNEVQTVTIGGTLSGGTFRILAKNADGSYVTTSGLAHNADAAAIQAALVAVLGTAAVAVAGATAPASFTITFSGAGYTGIAQPAVQLDVSALTGATTASVVRTTPGGTAGTYTYGIALTAAAPSGADGTAQVLVRDAVVVEESIILSGADLTAVKAALAAKGIFTRSIGSLTARYAR